MPKLLSRALAHYGLLIVAAVVLGIGVFELLHISVFSKFGSPHAVCYLADAKLIWLHVTSDSLIGIAYVSISLTLAYMIYKASKDIPFHIMFLAFGLFIVSCGFTHFMEVMVVWQPLYWLAGYIKVVTAAASVATAIALFPLIPKVFQLVDEVKKAEARRQRIEVLNAEMEAFTSSVAHDLRSPLRGIAGMSIALKEDYAHVLDETGRQYAERIVSSAQRMDRLIIDLLNYSRVSNDALEFEAVDLDALMIEVRNTLANEITERKPEIIVASPLGTVRASPTLLTQVVTNLVSNAMKFVAPGERPAVRISSVTADNVVKLTIADNGIGIPVEHQQRIFRMFERLSPDYPGTGIGLAIVQKGLERMGGKVSLKSAPGQGTAFTIELPTPARQ